MANKLSYGDLRRANLEENKRMLQELGVNLPFYGEKVMLNKSKLPLKRPKSDPKPAPESQPDVDQVEEFQSHGNDGQSSVIRSFRLRIKKKIYNDEVLAAPLYKQPRIRPDNSYGKIEGVEVGREWATRMDCSYDLVHRPTVAGIHAGPEGAYSVALSGGYEDDVDFGESFTYTGEGGRDLKGTVNNPKNLRTAPQSKDQSLERGNLALSISVDTQNPVRVIRGYKLDSPYAPEEGYRYDGLYQVKKFWAVTGKSGFKVFKFAFIRCDPEPAPWTKIPIVKNEPNVGSPTSPTTPTSTRKSGMEASEAPSLDEDASETFTRVEGAKKGASPPLERGKAKKKVSFNSTDSIRFYEKDKNRSRDDQPRRVSTRSTTLMKRYADSDSDSDIEEVPENLPKNSEDSKEETPKTQTRGRPRKKNEEAESQSLVKWLKNSTKSPLDKETGSAKNPGKASEENSPTNYGGQSTDKKSPSDRLKSAKSPTEIQSKKSMRSSPEDKRKEREVSPEYPPVEDRPQDENKPKKRSVTPEDGKKLLGNKSKKRSVSPEYPPEDEKKSVDNKPKKRSLSPICQAGDGKKPFAESKPKRSTSPEYPPEQFQKRSRGRPRKDSITPEKRRASPHSVQKSNVGKRSNSPESPTENATKKRRSGSPEYYRDKKAISPKYLQKSKSPKTSERNPDKHADSSSDGSKLKENTLSEKSSPKLKSSDTLKRSPGKSDKVSAKASPKASIKASPKTENSPKINLRNLEKSSSKIVTSPNQKALKSPTKTERRKVADKSASTSSDEESPNDKKSTEKSRVKSPSDSPNEPGETKRIRKPSLKKLLSYENEKSERRTLSPKQIPSPKSEKNRELTASPEQTTLGVRRNMRERRKDSVEPFKKNTEDGNNHTSTKDISTSNEAEFSGKEDHSSHDETPTSRKETSASNKKAPAPNKNAPAPNKRAVTSQNGDAPSEKEHVSSEKEDATSGKTDTASDKENIISREEESSLNEEEPISTDGEKMEYLLREKLEETIRDHPQTVTPLKSDVPNSRSSSPVPKSSSSSLVTSPVSKSSVENTSPVEPSNDFDCSFDEDMLDMMAFSIGLCSGDGNRVTVKMVNGKWVEVVEKNTEKSKENKVLEYNKVKIAKSISDDRRAPNLKR